MKIGIIGAGPAGLGLAEALTNKGYDQITVLERLPRVGGQSYSKSYLSAAGTKITYELGSQQPVSGFRLQQLMHK